MMAITINFNPVIEIRDEQFYQLCIHNPETKIGMFYLTLLWI